ncbi:hypothetical protein LJR009_005837 [Bosea sp. LjRoot9]|uniref:hypothetical protein n=1 Tax=Bosea sp. LjRoot9 TaxID=3342341 RepID=UPI003ECDA431
MITIFILLGLAFLGGGAAAIVDGWPYLVLERGFTEVIIGAIAATAGLLMLMLSYVLVEIRRLRTSLSNAVLAASLASMAGGEPALAEGAAHRGQGTAGVTVGTVAGLGLAAGAGAAVIAGSAAHATQPDVSPEAGAAAEHEPDFFGELLAHEEASSSPAAEAASSAPFDAPKAAEASEAEPVSAGEEAKEPAPEAADADKAESTAEAAAEPLQAKAKASIETEAEPHGSAPSDLESSFEELLQWPEPEPRSREFAASSMTGLDDEFGALRDSLSKRLQLGEPDVASAPAEVETPLSAARDPEAIESAAAWMAAPSRKHDSWFPDDGDAHDHDDAQDPAPTPAEAPQTEAELPPWPPVTHGVEVPAQEHGHEHEAEPAAAAASELPEDEAGQNEADQDDAASVRPGDEAAGDETLEEEASAAAPPAASEEGIVGAYQVGDAHFTIFADGSIKARTPDGDYNFASMDELKIYLASEKSRLGV